jgi:hypothetical protein
MNANELADKLHLISSQEKDLLNTAVTMLRQQQVEIKTLKAKTLTDEEITVIATQGRSDLTIPAHISFARAILKKASEK